MAGLQQCRVTVPRRFACGGRDACRVGNRLINFGRAWSETYTLPNWKDTHGHEPLEAAGFPCVLYRLQNSSMVCNLYGWSISVMRARVGVVKDNSDDCVAT